MILINLFERKEWRSRCRERTCGHSWEGKSGMSGENSIDIIYTIICEIDSW